MHFGTLGGDGAVQQQLVAQLHSYSEVFQSWVPVLDKLIDRMLGVLGVTAEEIDTQFVEQYRIGFRDKLIDDLRRSVQELTTDEDDTGGE
ncbi:MAG: hypothetical protein M3460_27275 [Actinomycetota bacterium]|nr:hypothetical protein [Actinomycetota bacterium]